MVEQGSQLLVVELATVILAGHDVEHILLYKKNPPAHLLQTVDELQF